MHVSRGLFNTAYNGIAYMHINQLIHKKLHIKMNLRCKDINIFSETLFGKSEWSTSRNKS